MILVSLVERAGRTRSILLSPHLQGAICRLHCTAYSVARQTTSASVSLEFGYQTVPLYIFPGTSAFLFTSSTDGAERMAPVAFLSFLILWKRGRSGASQSPLRVSHRVFPRQFYRESGLSTECAAVQREVFTRQSQFSTVCIADASWLPPQPHVLILIFL